MWDGSYRTLYVDDEKVARDTNPQSVGSANGGLHIGADKTPRATSFFSGVIDDVRVYDGAVEL